MDGGQSGLEFRTSFTNVMTTLAVEYRPSSRTTHCDENDRPTENS